MKSLRNLLVIAFSLGVAITMLAAGTKKKQSAKTPTPSPVLANDPDSQFDKMALDFIGGYLAARPLLGVALGLHQYDGKIGDYTRLAIDAELERLHRFQNAFSQLDGSKLSQRAEIDRRILLSAIASQLLRIEDLGAFDKNPMTYASALNLNIYIKRDFKPLDDRVRDIVTIEDQAANIMTAAKTNLAPVLPKPYVDLGIQIANGSADFLEKDLVAALKDLDDSSLMDSFRD